MQNPRSATVVTGIDGKGTSCQSSQSDSTISRIGQLTTQFCSVQIMSIQLVRKQLTCAGLNGHVGGYIYLITWDIGQYGKLLHECVRYCPSRRRG